MTVQNLFANRFGQLDYFNRTALVVAAADKSFFFERRKMLVHRRQRSELQRVRNFLKTRRIAVLVEEPDQVVQDFLLPLCERHFRPLDPEFEGRSVGELKAKVNGTCGQAGLFSAVTCLLGLSSSGSRQFTLLRRSAPSTGA